jgi:membrane associated rhomboid family serine protease
VNWKLWTKGLLSAVLGGAAATVGQAVTDPSHITSGHFGNVAGVAASGAIIGLVGYLLKSPLAQVQFDASKPEARNFILPSLIDAPKPDVSPEAKK